MAKVILLRNVDEELHKRVKIQAAREEMTMQALVIKAIQLYLAKERG